MNKDMMTARELEVLNLVLIGHSNKYIADELGISKRVVEIHIKSLREKIIHYSSVFMSRGNQHNKPLTATDIEKINKDYWEKVLFFSS